MALKVRAIRQGYYGKLRQPGDEFTVFRKEDMGSWMEVVEAPRGKPARAAADDSAGGDNSPLA